MNSFDIIVLSGEVVCISAQVLMTSLAARGVLDIGSTGVCRIGAEFDKGLCAVSLGEIAVADGARNVNAATSHVFF